jgi:hypothetical protein
MARQQGIKELRVTGYSIESNAAARVNGLLEACKKYASLVTSERILSQSDPSQISDATTRCLPESVLSGWTGGQRLDTDVPFRLIHADVVENKHGEGWFVPAAAVFPFSSLNLGIFERANVGLGVDFNFDNACELALMALYAHELLKSFAQGKTDVVEIDLSWIAKINSGVEYVLRSLKRLGRAVRLVEISNGADRHVVLASAPENLLDPERMTVGCSRLREEAITTALTEFLALSIGSKPAQTVEEFLPGPLGYIIEIPPESKSVLDTSLVQERSEKYTATTVDSWGAEFPHALIVNITNEDMRQCGLTIVKALFARSLISRVDSLKIDGRNGT